MSNQIEVNSWNGWNECYVVDRLTPYGIMREMARARRTARKEADSAMEYEFTFEAEAIDGEIYLTVTKDYEYHGWRKSTVIFTTAKGTFSPDEYDDNYATWEAA